MCWFIHALAQHPVISLCVAESVWGWLVAAGANEANVWFNPHGGQLTSVRSSAGGRTQPRSLRALPAKGSQGRGCGLTLRPHLCWRKLLPMVPSLLQRSAWFSPRLPLRSSLKRYVFFRIFLFLSMSGYLPSTCYALRAHSFEPLSHLFFMH